MRLFVYPSIRLSKNRRVYPFLYYIRTFPDPVVAADDPAFNTRRNYFEQPSLALITLELVAQRLVRVVAGLEVRHRVVLAQAVLSGQTVANVAVTVALAPHALAVLHRKVASLAPLAAKSDRVSPAVDADGLVPFRMQARLPQLPQQFRARSGNADVSVVGEIVRTQETLVAQPPLAEAVFGHAVAVLPTGLAISSVSGVADEPGLAFPAGLTRGVVPALYADVELVEAGALGVHVAFAGGVAAGADKGKVTAAHLGRHAVPVQATRLADRPALCLATR